MITGHLFFHSWLMHKCVYDLQFILHKIIYLIMGSKLFNYYYFNLAKWLNFLTWRECGMDKNGISPCLVIGSGPLECLTQPPPRYERLHSCHNLEVLICLSVLARAYFLAELINVSQFFFSSSFVEQRVAFGEDFILQADPSHAPLFEFAHQSTSIVVIAVAGVPV